MDIAVVSGGAISEAETQLLDDVVAGFADFKGRPAVRSKSGLWKSTSFILGVEVAEKFAYNGISSNLISYLTGPLGQSTAVAAANVNAWNGAAALLPLLGAFVADSFLGRYRTIMIAVVVYILSLGFLSLSATLHSDCKISENSLVCSPPLLEVVVFYLSLYLAAFAEGGMRPCIQAFGADQFDEENINESKAKNSFFNWWYFSMAGGSLLALLILNYIQENLSWQLGFGIPCIVMCFALLLYLLGSFTYRFRLNNDEKNPFIRISRVFMNAVRNRHATLASAEEQTKFKFLDKAVLAPDASAEGESLCSKRDMDDAKAILKLLPIWLTCLGYAIVLSQSSTLFTKQGKTMDREIMHGFEIPAATLQSLISITVILSIPLYDRVLVPVARAMTKKPAGITMLQRVGTGLFISFLSMVIAALVERRRLATAAEYGVVDDEAVPMSVWWLAPQYVLFGVSEVFVVVGLQEFFYDQVPNELKSIGLAMYLSILGIGDFLSSLLISVIESITSRDGHESWFSNNMNRAHLDYFYWLLAGLSAVIMAAYGYFAKFYVYKKRDLM
ncbi:Major facilitator superfamily protein [Perilla frutescens var. hirtella]|uniref:Major facilitator superfamily protein n=1 Tax=Perilla frutescens var. hirtella TaxID=608512 RepID=A0AAD4PCQ3_PERFH|nr:Major facilitator superfamily protein [Perilla frutescens var. hirtella]